VRGAAADRLLADMFARHRLFRLMADEVEKSLMLTDMEIAAAYAGLVEDAGVRETILGHIRDEHAASVAALRDLTSAPLGARFPIMQEKCRRLQPQLGRINLLQVSLLRRSRTKPRASVTVPLMQTMNCIAAGLGWTG
jgi:phosphoenolpyruvate carboxylase